jgi:hypothetical protein
MNNQDLASGNGSAVPFRCISFDEKVISNNAFQDLVESIYLSIHQQHRLLIADWCRREVKHFTVECSDLFADCEYVHGLIEKQYSQLAIKFPCSLFRNDIESIRHVIAHEFGHLLQYAQGLHRRDVANDRKTRYFEADRQVYLDSDNNIWGNGKEFENDANRLAGAWGFPLPEGNWDKELIATGEMKIHCYTSGKANRPKNEEFFDSLASIYPSPGVCFEIKPVDLDGIDFEERDL